MGTGGAGVVCREGRVFVVGSAAWVGVVCRAVGALVDVVLGVVLAAAEDAVVGAVLPGAEVPDAVLPGTEPSGGVEVVGEGALTAVDVVTPAVVGVAVLGPAAEPVVRVVGDPVVGASAGPGVVVGVTVRAAGTNPIGAPSGTSPRDVSGALVLDGVRGSVRPGASRSGVDRSDG